MHHVKRGGEGEQVAAQFGIPRHGRVVDVVAQRMGNGGGLLRDLLHIVGKAGVRAKVAVGQRVLLRGIVVPVEK